MKYFSYYDGKFQLHETKEAAKMAAASNLELEKGYADEYEGWAEIPAKSICWGELTQTATPTDDGYALEDLTIGINQ